MTQLILKMSISVDGFVGGPNGEIDWIFDSMDGATTAWIVDTLRQTRAHVMGSRTFHDMAAHWPTSTEPFADPMNALPKVVFTHGGSFTAEPAPTTQALTDATRRSVAAGRTNSPASPERMATWRAPMVANGDDLPGEIARLKRELGGPLLAHGGARFAQALVRAGLVDEYRLVVHPVVLGRGLPLFGTLEAPRALTLVGVTPFASGAAAHVYRR
ncbi:MAG: bifunctional deaminase-reductase-like protein [Gemmatimonadetes bacterium]|nr:bifunctional deaminase-reductase-like protein [Gemmatimonadota bacterium]